MFTVPSSDPPSTPDSRRQSRQGPSTTPAGPPPTGYTAQSFTPAGPPPASSLFDGSYTQPINAFSNPKLDFGVSNMGLPGASTANGAMFTVPSSPPHHFMDGIVDDDGAGSYEDDGAGLYNQHGQQDGMFGSRQPVFGAFNSIPAKHTIQDSQPFADYDSPRDLKRSRYGQVLGNSFRGSRAARLDARQSTIASIAKGFAKPANPSLAEPNDLILKSEQLLANLDSDIRIDANSDIDTLTLKTAQRLCDLWKKDVSTESIPGGIGPKSQSALDQSNYLASLLLRLYHPFASHKPKTSASTPFGRSSRFTDLVLQRAAITTVPRALLDWLNTYHNPFPEDLPEVLHHKPAPIAHEKYWDMIYATTLRGDLATAISLLDGADFSKADTAMDDGYDQPGYHGRQAEAASYVTSRCIDLLESCPAYAEDDWDVKNAEWAIFRNRVRREIQELEAFAESDSKDRDSTMDGANVFQSSTAGPGRNGLSFSTASRRAESKVPWTVYQNLKILYGQIQGLKDEISVCTQDWLETAVYLTVWWDGEDDETAAAGNLAASRHSLRQSQQIRPVDVSPTSSYRRQLLYAFATVTDDPEDTVFAVNTMDPLQVALACICEENVEGLVGILRGWSLPIASAVVEIASAGGWLPQSRSSGHGLLDGFDQDDLMVLSHGQEEQPGTFNRDEVLSAYADVLASEEKFVSSDGKTVKEGWDLACRVLSRLDSLDAAQRKIGQLLAEIPLDSGDRVDRVLAVCIDIGLPDQVRAIAERYADTLAETSQSYGSALIYYARAHSQQKLKSTIDLLISMCLVQSAAFPPNSSLDPQLDMILNDQRTAVTKLAKVDTEAAELIATYLSGYATLRRFYDMRDASFDTSSPTNLDPASALALKLKARKREAAKAILALIESANASIRGGLYDAEVETVVQVDTLMALLCEALPLLNQNRNPILKTPQLLVLLRAVEDLEAVTPLVYDQAESLFKAAIANYIDSPTHLVASQDLAKSVSGAFMAKSTNSLAASSYGMVASNGSLATSTGDEDEKIEIQRGWDWRKGAAHVGKSVTGQQMLTVLRTQVAKDMATSWLYA